MGNSTLGIQWYHFQPLIAWPLTGDLDPTFALIHYGVLFDFLVKDVSNQKMDSFLDHRVET